MNLVIRILVVVLFSFILLLTIRSHVKLRRRKNDTLGKKLYRYLVCIVSALAISFGLNRDTFVMLSVGMCATLVVERLIVYRSCYRNDFLSRFLHRINF